MTRLPLLLPVAALLACASTAPHGLLRVERSGADTGPGSADEDRLVAAVRDAAGAEGLACQPGTGGDLLRCSPAAVGNTGHALVITLGRAGTGYAVSIVQSVRLPGMSSAVCETQARVQGRLAAAMGPPAVRVDAGSGCKQR